VQPNKTIAKKIRIPVLIRIFFIINIYIICLGEVFMCLDKNGPLYWLALILPLLGQLILIYQFYSIGQLGYSILTAAIFLIFAGMTYHMCFKKK
jgi:hypothetical protein